MLNWLYGKGDWRAEWDIPLSRKTTLHIRPRCQLVDWRIGFYLEPGFHRDELGFLELAPLPTISILFALYRRED